MKTMNENQKALANSVLRIKFDDMTNEELNLGLAILMGFDPRVEEGKVYVKYEGLDEFEYFPMDNDVQFFQILRNQPFVVASHEKYDDKTNSEKVTGYWYSAHAYIGGTSTEGHDYKEVVAETAMKLLEHNM